LAAEVLLDRRQKTVSPSLVFVSVFLIEQIHLIRILFVLKFIVRQPIIYPADFKVRPFFDAEYLQNGCRYGHI